MAFTAVAQSPEKLLVVQPQKKWAICIGASKYQHLGELNFAAKDAVDFGGALVKDYGYGASTVTVLADKDGFEAPTTSAINRAVDRVLSDPDLDRGDQFVFYFSGHGAGFKSGDYFLPTDAKIENREKVGLSVTTILSRLTKAGLKNIVVIADACRAGERSSFGSELIDFGRRANIAVLLGCQPGEKSYELPKQKQGAFTFSLLKAMNNQKLSDPISGALWLSELGKAVAKNVETNTSADYGSNAQKPVIFAEKAQDVAIAVFPKITQVAKVTIEALLENAENEKYAGRRVSFALSVQAFMAYDEKRFGDAEKIYQAIDALGDITDLELLNYVSILLSQGKRLEAGRMIARYAGVRPWTKRLAIATFIAPLWTVGEKVYRQAIDFIKPESFKDPAEVISFQIYARENVLAESRSAVADYLKTLLPSFKNDKVATAFLQAGIDRRSGKAVEAERALATLLLEPQGSITHEDIAVERIDAALQISDLDQLKKVVSEAITKFPNNWRVIYFDLLLASTPKSDGFVQKFKSVLDKNVPNDLLLDFIHDHWAKLGNEISLLLTWLKKHEDHPGASKTLWAMEIIGTRNPDKALPKNVLASYPSDSAAYEAGYDALEKLLQSADSEKVLAAGEALELKRLIAFSFRNRLSMVEANPDLSYRLALLLNEIDLPVTAWVYIANEAVEKMVAGFDSARYLEERYLACLNMGDDAGAEAVWERLVEKGDVSNRAWLTRLANFVLREDFESATPIFKRLGDVSDSEIAEPLIFLRVWQTFKQKGRDVAMKEALKFESRPFQKTAMNELLSLALGYELIGQGPSLKLFAQLAGGGSRVLWLRQLVYNSVSAKLISEKSETDKALALALQTSVMNYPGTFWGQGRDLPEIMSLSDFEGSYSYALEKDTGIITNISRITFQIDAKGVVTGKMMNFEIVGTVDRRGNFNADVIVNGKKATRIFARLPSLKLLKATNPTMKWDSMVRFNMVQRNLLIAYYKSKFVGS
jgi:hypothetical protein